MTKAVFLDRDGVINQLVYHEEQEVIDSPFTANQFKLLPGVPEAIKLIHQAGYLVVLVSNQPGIAKGNMSAKAFAAITRKMRNDLSQFGVKLDGEYYCLHHPEAVIEKYKQICKCRKPQAGLLLEAAQEMDIELKQSWMVGDNLSDILAGKRADCRTILISKMKCELCQLMEQMKIKPDHIVSDILKGTKIIFDNDKLT